MSLISVLVTNAILLISPKILKWTIDDLQESISPRKILLYALLIFGVAVVGGIIRFAQRKTIQSVARKTEYYLRSDFFSHLQKLSASYYSRVQTGDLMARATSDMNAVRMMLSTSISFTLDAIVFFGFALIIMLDIDVSLTLYALLPYPVLAILIRELGTRIHKTHEKIQEAFSDMNTAVQENLSGVRVVKAYTLEDAQKSRFQEFNQNFVRRNRVEIRLMAFFFPIFRFLPGIGGVVLLWLGGMRVVEERITLGDFVSFSAYLMMLIRPMIMLGFVVNSIERGAASMKRITRILDENPDIYDSESVNRGIQTVEGAIELKNLNFAYQDGVRVLKDINLKIEPGETVAVVGPTGCGKTTLVNLIPRIYQADRGTIFVDGVDIQDIPIEILRSNIGFVSQEPYLFSDFLRNNIAFGDEDANELKIKDAAHAADLLAQIEEFPDGLDTFLGERGITISGGQRQRTALARAILVNPRILILDDAFANVDTHTEDTILERLRGVMANRTTLIISHRISTVKAADLIVVLKDGEIVERGTHENLLARSGIYAGIHERQLLQEELEGL
ncbi:MAG: ABC transporter ATP-binding protein [Candidatus Poribacteria bacterium]|nr:ABC transporter ATP-binding protein [Candidatus Poribacteria bacterium]